MCSTLLKSEHYGGRFFSMACLHLLQRGFTTIVRQRNSALLPRAAHSLPSYVTPPRPSLPQRAEQQAKIRKCIRINIQNKTFWMSGARSDLLLPQNTVKLQYLSFRDS